MGAQRRKSASSKTKKSKPSPSYFRRKAGSKSARNSTKNAVKSERRRTAKTARSSAKKAAKAAKRSLKTTKRKTHRAKTSASISKQVSKRKVSSPISKYFLSSDIAKQKSSSVAHRRKKAFEKSIEAVTALNTGLQGRTSRTRLTRMEIIRRNFMIMLRRFLSWFSNRSVSLNMTVSGKRALTQLEDLYDLLTLEAIDEESLLRLKVAYGEARYYVTQASRGYHKKHSGRGRENYRPYFDRFVDSSTG